MGNYNILYKEYYRKINNKKTPIRNGVETNKFKKDDNDLRTYRFNNYNEYSRYNKEIPYFKKNYIEKVIIRHLIGTLCLFIIFIGLKLVVTPETKDIYGFCKKEITREYSIEDVVKSARSIDYRRLMKIIEEGTEKIKSFNLEEKLDFLKIDP